MLLIHDIAWFVFAAQPKMSINGQYPDTILAVITYAEYTHAQISPFLVRNIASRRRRLQINFTFIYSSTRELRTHVVTALLCATGASTTYAPSAKAAVKLVIESILGRRIRLSAFCGSGGSTMETQNA
jgi:hypothetical protein